MWPAFTQKYVDVARWSKKLPTPGLDQGQKSQTDQNLFEVFLRYN